MARPAESACLAPGRPTWAQILGFLTLFPPPRRGRRLEYPPGKTCGRICPTWPAVYTSPALEIAPPIPPPRPTSTRNRPRGRLDAKTAATIVLCGLQVLPLRLWEKNAPQANVARPFSGVSISPGPCRPFRVKRLAIVGPFERHIVGQARRPQERGHVGPPSPIGPLLSLIHI